MAKENLINLQRRERKCLNNYYFNLFIPILFFLYCDTDTKVRILADFTSEINLVIEGSGTQQLINDQFSIDPYIVIVNGEEKNSCTKTCDLVEGLNNVTLKFNVEINTCASMFKSLNNIKEIDLSNFDATKVTTMESMFSGCSNLIKVNFGTISTPLLKKMNRLFEGCSNLISVDLSNLDTSKITNIEYMFSSCSNLENIIFGTIRTSPIQKMVGAFKSCPKLISVDISIFDTSSAKDFSTLFDGCNSLKEINFGNINTSSAENMYATFSGCTQLTSIDLSKFNTSKVRSMEWMFNGCKNLKSIKLDNFDTSNVQTMGLLFQSCSNLTSLDLSNFDMSKVKNLYGTFNGCSNLETIKFGTIATSSPENIGITFQGCKKLTSIDLSNIDFTKATSMEFMFHDCSYLKEINFGNIKTPEVKNMEGLFQGCSNLTSLDLSNFDCSKVTKMNYLVHDCKQLENINFGNINTSSLESMKELFRGCSNLISVDISNFDTSKVTNMEMMFFSCSKLQEVNFGNYPTPSLQKMSKMFQSCSELVSVDLSNFDTSKIKDISSLFNGCSKLTSIDLSDLDFSQVTNMEWMFSDCSNLETINFGNKNTSSLLNMWATFQRCKKLESIDLSNFDTSKVTTMEGLFYSCSNLKYVNLTNINTSSLANVNNMFYGCGSLIYLDLNSLKFESSDNFENIFRGLPLNVIYCIQDITTKNNLLNSEQISFCSDECLIINNTKIDINNRTCIESCLKSDNKFDYKNICYNKCPNGSLMNNYLCEDNICEEDGDNSLECSNGKPLGYFLDLNDNIYKRCFDNCNFCYGEGNETNNNCLECKSNYRFLNESKNDKNCYLKCDYYYFDEENIYHCNENKVCPENYTLKEEKNECVFITINETNIQKTEVILTEEKTFNQAIYECFNDGSEISKCSLKDIYNNSEIYYILLNDILVTYSAETGKNIIIEGKDHMVFQITSEKNEIKLINNQNESSDYNLSLIDLNECESLLKKVYSINENDSLIFIKQEKISDKTSEKEVKYECFDPYNKTRLNLSICSGININIFVKLELSDDTKSVAETLKELGYDMFDINDEFYQDICTTYKSTVDSDMLLTDRIDYIYYNDDAQCPDNCEFFSYFLGSLYINCSCSIDEKDESETEKIDKLNAETFFESFYYVLKYSNFESFKCYQLVFNKKVLTKNIGSYIIIVFFLGYVACLVLYIIKGITPLKNSIENIVEESGKNNSDKINKSVPPKRKKSSRKKKDRKESSRTLTKMQKINLDKISNFQYNTNKNENSKNSYQSNDIIINDSPHKRRKKKLKSKFKKNEKETELKFEENKNEDKPKELDDFELNELSFTEAAKKDKRTFLQIYLSLIKREHRIIFTFFIWNDYNLFIIKLSRFLFLLATDIAMNVIFFSDATMHKIFLNYGKYDFIQQIPQILYSTIISQLIQLFLRFISYTDKHVYEIKKLNPSLKNRKKIMGIIRCIKIKLIIFCVFTFLFVWFYWYVVSVFCAVYENTQGIFLLDSFISFLLSNIYPFIIYLILSALRILFRRCIKNKDDNNNNQNIK